MGGSLNKHELDIPLLNPESYIDSFLQKRDEYISKNWDENELEQLKKDCFKKACGISNSTVEVVPELSAILIGSHSKPIFFLSKIQKKFAVFGRIVDQYDSDFRKSSDNDCSVELYALAAIVFLQRFLNEGDFNSLNTGIKLCDRVCELYETDNLFIRSALGLENIIIRRMDELR